MRAASTACLLLGLLLGPVYGIGTAMRKGELAAEFDIPLPASTAELDDSAETPVAASDTNAADQASPEKSETPSPQRHALGPLNFSMDDHPVRFMAAMRYRQSPGSRAESRFQIDVVSDEEPVFSHELLVSGHSRYRQSETVETPQRTTFLGTLRVGERRKYRLQVTTPGDNPLPIQSFQLQVWTGGAEISLPVVGVGGFLLLIGFAMYLQRAKPQVDEIVQRLQQQSREPSKDPMI